MNGSDPYARGSRQTSSRDHHATGRDDRRPGESGGRDRGDRERDRDAGRDRESTRPRDDGRDRLRRRSRSPAAAPRRAYDNDSYSSSRGYREREREDRFGDRDRRDRDRMDRDGGRGGGAYGRREPPRRDDGPPRRDRDRDGYDDRRGGSYGGGRRDQGRDPFPRQRSASPPKKPKEPTPDLTDIESILTLKRRLTQWDIKPQGYERITAEQAKLSGMFPLPGAPKQAPMDPSRLQAFIDQPAGDVSSTALAPTNSRQSKRLFVENLPPSTTSENLRDFFNLHLNGLNIIKGHDPCLSAQLSQDKKFALLEFKTAEDATYALTLAGISMEDVQMGNGADAQAQYTQGLRIRRPNGYIAPISADDSSQRLENGVSTTVPDSPGKIAITNIPIFVDGEEVQGIFATFGPLKSFVVVKDVGSDQSRGVAFCEFADQTSDVTNTAVEKLNGLELVDVKLRVFHACVGEQQLKTDNSVKAMQLLATQQRQGGDMTPVLCLLNMVTAEELIDDEEYEEICGDVRDECAKYGTILDLKIPRPVGGANRNSNGVGKIYIKYDSTEAATKALTTLAGRNFAHRTVLASYYDSDLFEIGAF